MKNLFSLRTKLFGLLPQLARRIRGVPAGSVGAAEYAHALENVSDAVAIADQAGAIRFSNAAFGRAFSGLPGELTSASLLDLTEKHENARLFSTPSGMVAIIRDTSEARRLEGQLRQAQKMEAVGRLAGGVAHDFNNLLTIINGYAELALIATEATNPAFASLREIRKAGEQAAELTQRLLAVGRSQLLQPRVVEINAVVSDLIEMVRPLLGDSIQFVSSLDPDAGCARLDPGQFRQSLLNLVVNARDAMPNGGMLLIETAKVLAGCVVEADSDDPADECVMISVSDDGTGMNEETKAHLFEPFFTTKEAGTGTGLGLSTTFGIVKQSGGHIEVDSAVGEGATFRMYFPRCGSEETAFEEVLPAERAFPGDELRGDEVILVVADDAGVRGLVSASLKLLGYTVLEAQSHAEAESICASHDGPIDVLLADGPIPGVAGQELARSVRRIHPGIRVLYTTAYPEGAIPRRIGPGAACIAKPFSPHCLARKVRELLKLTVRHSVLVVDDEPPVRALLADLLGRAGYDVLSAGNGDEALQLVQEFAPALVLMDLVMPGKEGLETIPEIRRIAPMTKIIAMSGAFGSRFLDIAAHLGANATLAKPLAADVLLSTVQGVLAGEAGPTARP